jgi:hypothetical protein
MADASYLPQVYREQGGNRMVVKSSGQLDIESGGEIDVESGGSLKLAGTAISATATEINRAADVSARVQEITATGAVTAGVQCVELNHATVAITATAASALNHPGLFMLVNTSASGTENHAVALTAGTFDGTNDIATTNAPKEALIVYFDSAGNGTIIENVGSVALSSS